MEFDWPEDFMEEPEEVEVETQPPSCKASTILYIVGALILLAGLCIPLFELNTRSAAAGVSVADSWEWNTATQIGAFGVAQGLFLFLLGISVDRRGA